MFWMNDPNRVDITEWHIDAELDFALPDGGVRSDDRSAHRIVAVEVYSGGTRCCGMCPVDSIREVAQCFRLPGRVCELVSIGFGARYRKAKATCRQCS